MPIPNPARIPLNDGQYSISEQQQTEEEDEDTNLFCACLHCVHQSSPTPNLTTPMDLDLWLLY